MTDHLASVTGFDDGFVVVKASDTTQFAGRPPTFTNIGAIYGVQPWSQGRPVERA